MHLFGNVVTNLIVHIGIQLSLSPLFVWLSFDLIIWYGDGRKRSGDEFNKIDNPVILGHVSGKMENRSVDGPV